MNAIIDNIENEVKSEVAKIEGESEALWQEAKLEYKKVVAILRAYLPGDHPILRDMKNLANSGEATVTFPPPKGLLGEATSPESQGAVLVTAPEIVSAVSASAIEMDQLDSGESSKVESEVSISDPKPVGTTAGIGGGE